MRRLIDSIGAGHNQRSPAGRVKIGALPLMSVTTVASCESNNLVPHADRRGEWIPISAEPDNLTLQSAGDCGRVRFDIAPALVCVEY